MRWISAFTGRAGELGLLCEGVRSGSTTLVVGDAGIGKTRLVAECAAEFDADGWLVVSASCLPLAEQLPLLPVVDGLRQLHLGNGGALLEDCLRDCSPYVRDDVARLVPELSSPSTGTAAGEGPRQRLFAAVLQSWRAVHQRRPLLIIVEDLHWSDGTTRDFFTYVSAQHGTGSVPVVVTSRPGDISDDGAVAVWSAALVSAGRWRQIHLPPLTPREVEKMAASIAPDPLSVDQIAAMTTVGLVGREAEVAAGDRLLASATAGFGGGLLLVGEAGIGKTRLLVEVVDRARSAGFTVLRGHCVPGGGTYRALTEAIIVHLRDGTSLEAPTLRPYRAALDRLAPGWHRQETVPSPLPEATRRLSSERVCCGC